MFPFPCPLLGASSTVTHDPHWTDVLLQLVFSAGITDQSGFGRGITNSGSLAVSGDHLVLDGSHVLDLLDSSDWTFAGDFCIDVWGANFTSLAADQWAVSHYDAAAVPNQRSFLLGMASSGPAMIGAVSTDGSTGINAFNSADHISAGTGQDVRLERTGTDLRLFRGGVMTAKTTASGTLFNSNVHVLIGGRWNSSVVSGIMTGSLKAVRITRTSRWGSDSNYTVETLPLPTS